MEREPVEVIDQRVADRIRIRPIDRGIAVQTAGRQTGVGFQQANKYGHGLRHISAGWLYHVGEALETPIRFITRPIACDVRKAPRDSRRGQSGQHSQVSYSKGASFEDEGSRLTMRGAAK